MPPVTSNYRPYWVSHHMSATLAHRFRYPRLFLSRTRTPPDYWIHDLKSRRGGADVSACVRRRAIRWEEPRLRRSHPNVLLLGPSMWNRCACGRQRRVPWNVQRVEPSGRYT